MRSLAIIAVLAVAAVVAVACYDIKPPPVPRAERVATIVGQIVGGTPGQTYALSTGEIVEVRDASGGSLREQLGSDRGDTPGRDHPRGGLILAGDDALGPFYAATRYPTEDGCFQILGPGYLQLDRKRVHLSTGLVLTLANDFEQTHDRFDMDSSWLFEFDEICLDASGEVTSVHQASLGA